MKFDFLGLKTLSVLKKADRTARRARHRRRSRRADLGRRERLQTAPEGRHGRRVPAGIGRHAAHADGGAPVQFRRHHRARLALPPGPDGQHPELRPPQERAEPIAYPHPLLEPILAETYGIFVYQEQVMQAAQVLAGYSLGGADLLRRAMGKKIKAEMDAQRAIFVEGCAESQRDRQAAKANELFDLIDKFAGYGFNKSHAAAYALLAYQTAWLKAHHPHEFYAASMCLRHAPDRQARDLRRRYAPPGVACLPPDINAQRWPNFDVEKDEDGLAVRYALARAQGRRRGRDGAAGRGARRQRAASQSLDDFAHRVDPRLLNKRQLETLAAAGAFDGIEPNRAGVFAAAETILAIAPARVMTAGPAGRAACSAKAEPSGARDQAAAVGALGRSPSGWRRKRKRSALFLRASGRSLFAPRPDARRARASPLSARSRSPRAARAGATMAALVEDARWRTSARGSRYLMATISDPSGQFVATCFDDRRGRGPGRGRAHRRLRPAHRRARQPRRARIRRACTVKRIQPFESLANVARMMLDLAVDDADALTRARRELSARRAAGAATSAFGHRSLPTAARRNVVLGRDFLLDERTARADRRTARRALGRIRQHRSDARRRGLTFGVIRPCAGIHCASIGKQAPGFRAPRGSRHKAGMTYGQCAGNELLPAIGPRLAHAPGIPSPQK